MDVFRTPDERFENLPGYPYEPNYVEVDGLRLHHLDEGSGSTVLCFHGEPSWSYLYRHMLDRLVANGHRVVCPDFAGFGRSDKPTDQGWYTYDRHVDMVSRHLDQLELEDLTVVVQDWGGPIGLRWAVQNADRVARLVILNTGLFTGRVSKGFMAWREFAERTPDLPIGKIIQGATTTDLPDEVVAAYDAPYPNPESKAGAQRFPLLVPLTPEDTGAAEMVAVKDALAGWDKPALVAFSDTDPVFPFPRAGERFTELLPTAGEQVRIEGAAHFLQEDRGTEIADAMIAAFARDGDGLMAVEPDGRQFARGRRSGGRGGGRPGRDAEPQPLPRARPVRERRAGRREPGRVGPRRLPALRRRGERRPRARRRAHPLAHRLERHRDRRRLGGVRRGDRGLVPERGRLRRARDRPGDAGGPRAPAGGARAGDAHPLRVRRRARARVVTRRVLARALDM